MRLPVRLVAAFCFSFVAPASGSFGEAVETFLPVFCNPAVGAAQTSTATAAGTLVQRYNDNVPVLNQLIKTLYFQEAVDKAKELLPPVMHSFDGKDPASIQRSLDEAHGAVALYNLYGNVLVANGQWEHAAEIFEKGVAYAAQIRADLEKTFSVTEDQWKKALEEGREYIAKHEGRIPGLEAGIAKVQEDIRNHNEKKVRLDKKQLEELQTVRIPKAQKDEAELSEIQSRVAAYKEAMGRYEKVNAWMAEQRKLAEEIPVAAKGKLKETSASLAKQMQEIVTFNEEEARKKKGIRREGNRPWVEAVLNNPSNILALGDVSSQGQFLQRLLVLDPGNKVAGKALQNLREGRPAFVAQPRKGRK